MISRRPRLVVVGAYFVQSVAAVAAVQVSRRESRASDNSGRGSDGVQVWTVETVDLGPWTRDTPGKAAALLVERAYLVSTWNDDAPVALVRPTAGAASLALYGAILYGLQANGRETRPETLSDATEAVTGSREASGAQVAEVAGRFSFSAGVGSGSLAEQVEGDWIRRSVQFSAVAVALAAGRRAARAEREVGALA